MRTQFLPPIGLGLIVAALLSATDGLAQMAQTETEPEGRLFIVSSFPKTLYARFTSDFEKRNPAFRVKVLSKKTSAAISYIQDPGNRRADIFWASAPDAFEVLKESGHLVSHRPEATGIPVNVGRYPVNDPDHYFSGFAVSGYGIMWNKDYLARYRLEEPRQWNDLKKPEYFHHLGISAPSRSGTTHVIVETILQAQGWQRGWATLLEMGGNMATVTARSFGVPTGVNKGRFGVGPVIDFFGLSSKAQGHPVEFAYPDDTTLAPASIAILKDAPNPKAAAAFIEFVLSPDGQKILFESEIRRLPILPAVYAEAPANYPNPFVQDDNALGIEFDSALSRQRYHMVNALFDHLITFRLDALSRAWGAVHEAERALAIRPNADDAAIIAEARRLLSRVPVTATQAEDSEFTGQFTRGKRGIPLPLDQAVIEANWKGFAIQNQIKAAQLAESVVVGIDAEIRE